MKIHLFLTYLFFLLGSVTGAQTLTPSVLGEKLTPLWAQEYIGSDLIREELLNLEADPVKLAVVDLGFEEDHIQLSSGFEHIQVPFQRNGNRRMRANHGTSVLNLLTGPSLYRVTDQAQLIKLIAAQFSGSYSYMYQQHEEDGLFPKVVSNSLGWRQDPKIAEVVKNFQEQGTLWFLAAGNNFPEQVDKVERESEAILIGSFSPSGLTSYEAQNHKNLLVLAPANEELLTINGYGKEHFFGASSGATPLVAGTVINLLALNPHLKKEHIRLIIKNSAYPSAENKLGLKQMPGLLNGYKAFKVAQRLKVLCEDNLQCINKNILREELFEFNLPKKLEEKFNCTKFKEADEAQKFEILTELRKLTFLGSNFHALETSCAYKTIGYPKNAEYFHFISQKNLDLDFLESQAKKALDQAIYQISYYRYGPYYSTEYLPYVNQSPMKEYHKEMLLNLRKEHLQGQ